MADKESPVSKRAKYLHCNSHLAVTEEMMNDFSRDGYIIVKCVFNYATPTYSYTILMSLGNTHVST